MPIGFHVLTLLPGTAFGHARSGGVNSLESSSSGNQSPRGGTGTGCDP